MFYVYNPENFKFYKSPSQSKAGIVPLTVTTSLNINFLRKPAADKDIIGVCKLMKVGKSLAVGEVALCSEGNADPVAHPVGAYSIPATREQQS